MKTLFEELQGQTHYEYAQGDGYMIHRRAGSRRMIGRQGGKWVAIDGVRWTKKGKMYQSDKEWMKDRFSHRMTIRMKETFDLYSSEFVESPKTFPTIEAAMAYWNGNHAPSQTV